MKETILELQQIVDRYFKVISSIPESEFSSKPNADKWSKKEVLGHLIDSGQNNLRRFICGQYEVNPKITYDQDVWVSSNNYQGKPSKDVILLWKLTNEQICLILESMPEANYFKSADTGKAEVQLHSLEWLAVDYVRHLKHHLNQIIAGSFDIVYK
ncbi:DinB family protein [soil metagenome]